MSDERTDREDCYICSRGHPDILEGHHIVPERYDGSNADPNIVELCPSCHQAIESLYDARFWAKVGALSNERQMGVIIGDIDLRLEGLEMDVLDQIRDARDVLEEEYRHTGYAEAREDALKRMSIDHGEDDEGADEDISDHEELRNKVRSEIRNQMEIYENRPGAPDQVVVETVAEMGVEPEMVIETIQSLRDMGEVYSPDQDHVRLV